MAINLPSGFKVTAQEPIDNRIVLTKQEMLNMIPAKMPNNYICVCKDDGKLYIWNNNFVSDPTTGKFRSYEDVMDISQALNKAMESPSTKAALETAVGNVIPGAMEKTMSTAESAQKVADAMFDSEHFEVNLDNKIDLAVSLIQAIDSN